MGILKLPRSGYSGNFSYNMNRFFNILIMPTLYYQKDIV
jgi:hypothetical protein